LKHFLMIWRIDQSINRPGSEGVAFRDIFCKNFYITTSGFFSDPAMLCCLQEMGVEHVLFSVDWPFVENKPGTDWMESISLSTSDKELILNGNAKRILHI
ncbi:MAG: amidohydrolase family protein, partial [Proteobacteria bacterium]|nr:amidohydrolase family protein [Pseudomonadota bacterium]